MIITGTVLAGSVGLGAVISIVSSVLTARRMVDNQAEENKKALQEHDKRLEAFEKKLTQQIDKVADRIVEHDRQLDQAALQIQQNALQIARLTGMLQTRLTGQRAVFKPEDESEEAEQPELAGVS